MIIDVSKYQGKINWDKTAPNCDFAIIRASCGTTKDPKAKYNADECDRLGLPYHMYHYIKGTKESDIVKEAKTFVGVASYSNPYYLVVDCEYKAITNAERKNKGSAKKIVNAFCNAVKTEYEARKKGCPPIAVYIGNNVYAIWKLDYSSFAYIWIPRYSEKKPYYPCDLWQYTSNGKIAGISGRVDCSRLNGNKMMTYFTNRYFDDFDYKGSFGGRELSIGNRGADVFELQNKLISIGYYLPLYGADSDFGYETKSAVIDFQKDSGLDVDGVVGEDTYSALNEYIDKFYPKYALIIYDELENLENIQIEFGGKIVTVSHDSFIE